MAVTWKKLAYVDADHGGLTGLSDDDHPQYAFLAGRTGGQTLISSIDSGGNLTLQSTAHATKGKILFGTSAYDEVNNRLGIGTTSPATTLDVAGDVSFNKYKAVAMACDNGTSFPASPNTGQWFYRTDIDTLFIYEAAWKSIISFGAVTLYVDGTNGSDAIGQGYGSGAGATATIQYAINLIPPINGGNVIVNVAAGTYAETVTIQGKMYSGSYGINLNGVLTQLLTATIDSGVSGTGATQGSITDAGAFTSSVTTTVDADSAAAQKILNVASTTNFAVGDTVLINSGGARQEVIRVASIQAGVSLTAAANLVYLHTALQADVVEVCKYAGKLVYALSYYRVIDYNTANTLVITGTYNGITPTGTYYIYDWGSIVAPSSGTAMSVINGQQAITFNHLSFATTAHPNSALYIDKLSTVTAYYCYFNGRIYMLNSAVSYIYNCLVSHTLTGQGFYIVVGSNANIYQSKITGCNSGFNSIILSGNAILTVFQGSIIENGATATIYAIQNSIVSFSNLVGFGYNRLRNTPTCILATIGSLVQATANLVYENYTTAKNPAGATDPSYID